MERGGGGGGGRGAASHIHPGLSFCRGTLIHIFTLD